MKRLRVDINDIAIAMESSNDIEESVSVSRYRDRQSNQYLWLSI